MYSTQALHKLISPLLYATGSYQRRWAERASQKPFTVVLVYHRVVQDGASHAGRFGIERGVSASVFEAQIRFMLKHFVPIKASQVLEPSSEPLRFAVTLDDGYEDNYLIAAPILRRLGVSATFFVVSDFVGTDRLFWWEQLADMIRETKVQRLDLQAKVPELASSDVLSSSLSLNSDAEREFAYDRLSVAMRTGQHVALPQHLERLSDALEVRPREEGRDYGLMNWNQLKELVHQGFEIGGHTATHCNVVDADQEMLQREIVLSIENTEHQIEAPVLSFAHPYGLFPKSDNSVTKILESTNCRVAFAYVKGVVEGQSKVFELPRTVLNRRFNFACAYNIQETLINIA